MPRSSAGLLLYRRRDGAVQVLLAHPGGPFWSHRDPRLKASILVGQDDTEFGIAEIERCAKTGEYVQINVCPRANEPLGRRRYWPIYERAQDLDLAAGVRRPQAARTHQLAQHPAGQHGAQHPEVACAHAARQADRRALQLGNQLADRGIHADQRLDLLGRGDAHQSGRLASHLPDRRG